MIKVSPRAGRGTTPVENSDELDHGCTLRPVCVTAATHDNQVDDLQRSFVQHFSPRTEHFPVMMLVLKGTLLYVGKGNYFLLCCSKDPVC